MDEGECKGQGQLATGRHEGRRGRVRLRQHGLPAGSPLTVESFPTPV